MARSMRWLGLAALLGLVVGASAAQDKTGKDDKNGKDKDGKAEEKTPKTAKVKKGPFQVEVSAKGTLEAKDMREVMFRRHTMTGPPGEPEILTITRVADRLERGFAQAILDHLIAHQPAKDVVGRSVIFRVLLKYGALEVLHSIILAGVREAFLDERLRNRVPEHKQRIGRIPPELLE